MTPIPSGIVPPECRHDEGEKPSGKGWILTCRADYERAVRINLLNYMDAAKAMTFETELKAARLEIQRLTSDLNDCLSARGITFIRCDCGRLKLKPFACRSCGA